MTQVGAPSHGSATLSGNTITYRPEAGFAGTDAFTYTITDAFNRTATATITITVNPPQLNAVNDAATTTIGTAITINVLANECRRRAIGDASRRPLPRQRRPQWQCDYLSP
ncbi:MAG: cadherin-like domain-containing protein [Synechococcaceae cyanobacterium SM1_2_3]|nr:cadherin-like domain-containing protein [Synechococcaceae cyanobacterium SM1_2_3]